MEKIRLKRIFWTIFVILYVGFVFHNSLTPAVESSRQSTSVLEMVVTITGRFGIGTQWITEHLIRKMAHFAEYTILGILLSITVREYQLETGMRRCLQCWLGTMIPLIDETLQLFTEGRSGQISDVWLDMAGIFTGFLLIGLFWKQRDKNEITETLSEIKENHLEDRQRK